MAEALEPSRIHGEALMAKDLLQDFEARVDLNNFDPALIPLQNDALKRVKEARDNGTEEDIRDAVRVAKELGALP